MEQKNWVKIHSTNQPHLAEIIRSVLEENEMECIIMNKKDSAYGFGEAEVYVLKEQVAKATDLIKVNNF